MRPKLFPWGIVASVFFLLPALGELLAIGCAVGALEALRRGRRGLAIGLWVGVGLIAVSLSVVSIYTMGGGFGPGTMLLMGNICLAPFLIPSLWFVAGGLTLLRTPGARVGGVVGMFGLFVAMCAPGIGGQLLEKGCDTLNRREAAPILERLQQYREQQGRYPVSLDALQLDPLPTPSVCHQPYAIGGAVSAQSFALIDCGDGKVLVTFSSLGQSSVERYDLDQQRWASPISFLDGPCNYLSR